MFADSSTHHTVCHPVSMSNMFAVRRGAVSYNLAVAKGTDGNSKGRGRKTARTTLAQRSLVSEGFRDAFGSRDPFPEKCTLAKLSIHGILQG